MMPSFFRIIPLSVGNIVFRLSIIFCGIRGEFVGLMFDETVQYDIRQSFEETLAQYSVLVAQQGTPTVKCMLNALLNRCVYRNVRCYSFEVWRIIEISKPQYDQRTTTKAKHTYYTSKQTRT
jgi:hypothetical protein